MGGSEGGGDGLRRKDAVAVGALDEVGAGFETGEETAGDLSAAGRTGIAFEGDDGASLFCCAEVSIASGKS